MAAMEVGGPEPVSQAVAQGASDAAPASAAGPVATDKIAKAESHKEAGNACFKTKEYKKAITRFSKIKAYTWEPSGEARGYAGHASATNDYTADERQQLRRLADIADGNIAACYLALEEPRKSLNHSLMIIAKGAEGTNPDLRLKALCRAAQAALKLNDLDASKAYVLEALDIDKQCAAARTTYKQLQAAYKKHNDKQKKALSAAFANKA